MNYEAFKQTIQSFDRDSLTLQLSYLSWKEWHLDEIPKSEEQDAHLIKCFAPRIAAIALGGASSNSNNFPKYTTARDLCRGSINVVDGLLNEELREEEAARGLRLFRKSAILSKFDFSDLLVKNIISTSFLQRLVISQSISELGSIFQFLRKYEIFNELEKTNTTAASVTHKLLNLTTEEAFRSAFALFSMFNGKNLDIAKPVLSLSESSYESTTEEQFGINKETLFVAASRLSCNISDIREWSIDLEALPEPHRHYAPLPFFTHPLVNAEGMSFPFEVTAKGGVYLCPSPYTLLSGIGNFISRILTENKEQFESNIQSDMGVAIENYLLKILPELFPAAKVTRVDDTTTKNADFIIETNKNILILECKRSLTTKLSRTISLPEDTVSVFEKIISALTQCSTTKKNISKFVTDLNKPIACIILTDEKITGESSRFSYFYQQSNMHTTLNVGPFDIMSIDDFEKVFSSVSANTAIARLHKNWWEFTKLCFINSYIPLSYSKLKATRRPYRHLKPFFAKLFPKLKNPIG